jgi:hypothetical protein
MKLKHQLLLMNHIQTHWQIAKPSPPNSQTHALEELLLHQ